MGLSAYAEWILNIVQEIAGVNTDPQGSWSTKLILFLSIFVYRAKTGPPEKLTKKVVLAMGLSACTEWIWNFVQEIAGVSTDPQGSWSTKQILFLSFFGLWSKDWSSLKLEEEKTCFGHGTVYIHWLDVELCTRDSWCKYWPTRELVHQAHSLPEFLGLWS